MELTVRISRVKPGAITPSQPSCQRWQVSGRSAVEADWPSLEPCPPGTEISDAETKAPKSSPETTSARRDRKNRKPVAEIPAQTARSGLTGKYPVRTDWMVAECSPAKLVSVGIRGKYRADPKKDHKMRGRGLKSAIFMRVSMTNSSQKITGPDLRKTGRPRANNRRH